MMNSNRISHHVRRAGWITLGVLAPVLTGYGTLLASASPHEGGHAAEGAHGAVEGAHHAQEGLVWISPIFGNEGKTGIIWLLVNFAVLMWILNKLLFQPLRDQQATKHDDVKRQIDEATEAREEAEALINEYRAKVDALDAETKSIIDRARERAEADRQTIIDNAQREAARIRETALAAAERDAEVRRRAIEDEVLERAIEKAETLIRERMTSTVQQKLVADYVDRLGDINLTKGAA